MSPIVITSYSIHYTKLYDLFLPPDIPLEDPDVLLRKQHAFGYSDEEIRMVISPMATRGQEPVGSMGDVV